jgi:hypothetical protein
MVEGLSEVVVLWGGGVGRWGDVLAPQRVALICYAEKSVAKVID